MEDWESQEALRWDSASTWIALGTLLFYCLFTLGLPLIPSVIRAGAMEGILLRYAPIVALVLWMAAMWDRSRRRRVRGKVLWTGFRYGIISLGAAGVLVMLVGLFTPADIRRTESFRNEMRKKADVQAIRLWAESYKPTVAGDASYPVDAEIPEKEWPESIRRIHPRFVSYNPFDKSVMVVIGGGYGLEVGPKGTGPPGGDEGTLPLEDGAWVWFHMRD